MPNDSTATLELRTLHLLSDPLCGDFKKRVRAAVEDCRDRPATKQARTCGHLLRSEASRKAGLGRTCARRRRQKLRPVLYCGECGDRLEIPSLCQSCGLGVEEKPMRVRRLWVKPGRKGPARFPKRRRQQRGK